MDKNAIKKYAVWARRELISRVSQKAQQFGITEKEIVDANADSVNGRLLSPDEKKQRQALIAKIKREDYEQVMEEVAYTWFNRFSALRFMEVNGYLPSHVRVFTDDEGSFKPQILAEAIHLDLDGLNMDKVYALKEKNDDEALFKYLNITQCNALSDILPGMFQRISDYTELLFPDNLLRDGSVLEQMISLIPEDDWKDQVQIIGWLYQYYNTEPKDKVFADLKKNIKITRENIPAATQLFTPDWIVRYMVENSLGRLWVEGHPSDELKAGWKYYLEEARQEPEVQAQLDKIREEYKALKPEDIKCIDPCMGSSHILVYMFDVLMQIYSAYGYTNRDAVRSILENNLYGLDIDDRAAQLAYFSVMMKARQYDSRFFTHGIAPNVYAICESNRLDPTMIEAFICGDAKRKAAIETIITELHDAKEYGSILNVTPQDFAALYARVDEMQDEISMFTQPVWTELLPLIRVAEALAQKYDVVVTNPPYMGASNMNPKLNEFIKKYYANYKSDFFSAFVVHCSEMAKQNGKLGFFTPYVWMFIQSYEKMRDLLCNQKTIETLIQFEYSAFEEATVPVCTFTFTNNHVNKKGCYFRLTDFRGGMEVQRQKMLEAISNHSCGYYYEQSTDNFSKIPGSPIAYWVSDAFTKIFSNKLFYDYTISDGQNKTGNNAKYVRFFWEVNSHAVGKEKKWLFYAKGGGFRKWVGNLIDVVDWSEPTRQFYRKDLICRIIPEYLWYKKGITWGLVTSNLPSFRVLPEDATFDVGGSSVFFNEYDNYNYFLGLLNSKVFLSVVKLLNPTLNFQVKDIRSMPIIIQQEDTVNAVVEDIITMSKNDWDSFETSWDFKTHPLIAARGNYEEAQPLMVSDDIAEGTVVTEWSKTSAPIVQAFDAWERETDRRFNTLKANEEELNRIFIDIYGLQDELTPEEDDKDVTVRKADLKRDIKSLLSYAVGCMFGRYSLDVEGLAYAGGEWDASKYKTFIPDEDNIIPICDDEYFEDDITGRFVKFIETVYGKDTLDENLRFIADALGGSGQPKDVIRNYFLNGFYADHLKIYQKRPIYWLFDSGKKNGFKALIYMHRYAPDTLARMRTDYVHEQQARYRTAIADVEHRMENASASERVKLNKQLAKLQDQTEEIRIFEEKIHHLADQMIRIDLDDGVKHNYEIFGDVLAKIK